ncbi:MAG: hypothetical protein SFX72_03940 [Isosphaeraceae bacterium]|nr:hypothetical protein [Isosphaeraceae bacterium]
MKDLRIADLMEWVAVLALGVVAARLQIVADHPRLRLGLPSDLIRIVGGSALSGIAFGAGVGLLVESIRGRTEPRAWGYGRWVLAISAIRVVLVPAIELGLFSLGAIGEGSTAALGRLLPDRAVGLVAIALGRDHAWSLIAFATAAWLSGRLQDPRPDSREWVGRVFASLVVATTVASETLHQLRH